MIFMSSSHCDVSAAPADVLLLDSPREMTAMHQIRQTVRFAAPPSAIYRALMESRRHQAFTGAPAKIDAKVGGRFTAWGPHLSGVTVELVKDKRIVQAWRAENWPSGGYSVVTFNLKT